MKLFLPQNANQAMCKCTHVIFIERYHIEQKISGEKGGGEEEGEGERRDVFKSIQKAKDV